MRQLAVPFEHVLDDRLAIHGVVHRLSHPYVVERLLGGVDQVLLGSTTLADLSHRHQFGIRTRLDLFELAGRWRSDDLRAARLQLGHAARRVGHDPKDEPLREHPALPVVLVRPEHQALPFGPLDELIWPCADRPLVECLRPTSERAFFGAIDAAPAVESSPAWMPLVMILIV